MEVLRMISLAIVVALSSLVVAGCDVQEQMEDDELVESGAGEQGEETNNEGGQTDDAHCPHHLPFGAPSQTDYLLCRETFTVGYNAVTKQADWVAYSITADSVGVYIERTDDFREDGELLLRARSTLEHYSGSGYDRGHLAPAATVGTTKATMSDSFILSNISPQLAGFNRDGWADLESAVRDCVYDQQSLYVITGPVIPDEDGERIDRNGPVIPSAFFKLIMTTSAPYKALALVVPHAEFSMTGVEAFIVTPNELEELVGIDIGASLDDGIEVEMESESVNFCAMPM